MPHYMLVIGTIIMTTFNKLSQLLSTSNTSNKTHQSSKISEDAPKLKPSEQCMEELLMNCAQVASHKPKFNPQK